MRGSPGSGTGALKPVLSMSINYSESVMLIAPTQMNGAIAALVAKLATRIRVDAIQVDWGTFKVEQRFSNQRNLWVTTVSVEEVK